MLLFELFPAFVLAICVPIGVWLLAIDRNARQREIEEQTTQVRPLRRRS